MKGSRITALGLVAAAGLWISSGHFLPHESAESSAAVRPTESAAQKLFRVAVEKAELVPHSQKLDVVRAHRSRPQGDGNGAHGRRSSPT